MISEKIETALNGQVNAEFYSTYLYLSMEAYFESVDFPGFAKWMRAQIQEESMHAMKIYDFVNERGGRIALKSIAEPPSEWASPLAAFEDAYKHEQLVTSLVNDLTTLAIEEKDHATSNFLQWFVNEQVEEEASVSGVVQKLKMVKDAPGGYFFVDNELGQRVFTPPVTESEG